MLPDLQTALSTILNALITLGAAYLVNVWAPKLRASVPWLIPLATPVLGFAFAWVQTWAGAHLGISIDLNPWLGALTGAAAVMPHEVWKRLVPEKARLLGQPTARW